MKNKKTIFIILAVLLLIVLLVGSVILFLNSKSDPEINRKKEAVGKTYTKDVLIEDDINNYSDTEIPSASESSDIAEGPTTEYNTDNNSQERVQSQEQINEDIEILPTASLSTTPGVQSTEAATLSSSPSPTVVKSLPTAGVGANAAMFAVMGFSILLIVGAFLL